jgi:hypothetical protein
MRRRAAKESSPHGDGTGSQSLALLCGRRPSGTYSAAHPSAGQRFPDPLAVGGPVLRTKHFSRRLIGSTAHRLSERGEILQHEVTSPHGVVGRPFVSFLSNVAFLSCPLASCLFEHPWPPYPRVQRINLRIKGSWYCLIRLILSSDTLSASKDLQLLSCLLTSSSGSKFPTHTNSTSRTNNGPIWRKSRRPKKQCIRPTFLPRPPNLA